MLLSVPKEHPGPEMYLLLKELTQSLSHTVTVLCCKTQMHQELEYPYRCLKTTDKKVLLVTAQLSQVSSSCGRIN